MRKSSLSAVVITLFFITGCKMASYNSTDSPDRKKLGADAAPEIVAESPVDNDPLRPVKDAIPMMNTFEFAAGEDNHCATGGVRIENGFDRDFNEILSPDEVTKTTYVCNGKDGLRGAPGAPGAPGTDSMNGSTVVIEKFATSSTGGKLDVVFALDNSSSMVNEIIGVVENMKTFLDKLLASDIDAQITIISRDYKKHTARCDAKHVSYRTCINEDGLAISPEFMHRVAIVDQYIFSTEPIGHLTRLFNGEYVQKYNRPLPLRDGVPVEIIIVSDDDGDNDNINSTTGNLAHQFIPPVGKEYRVHAIVGQTATATGVVNVGVQHNLLADLTGGLKLDILSPSMTPLFSQLVAKIEAESSFFKLNHKLDDMKDLKVYAEGVLLEAVDFKITGDILTILKKTVNKTAITAIYTLK